MDQNLATLPFLLELERPEPGAALVAGTRLNGFGWVLSPTPLHALHIYLNDLKLCQATIGLPRADVAAIHAGHPACAESGFMFAANIPAGLLGPAILRLIVRTTTDEHVHEVPITLLSPSVERTSTASLDAIRVELEEALVESTGQLRVRGWAVSQQPIRHIEVLQGAETLGFADAGQPRADVAVAFEAYPNAATAGFTFETRVDPRDVAAMQIAVLVKDATGATRTATLRAKLASAPSRTTTHQIAPMLGKLEEAGVNERGILRARGWAASLSPIEKISVYIDDFYVGDAARFLPRDDVGAAHPDYPDASFAGYLLQQEIPDDAIGEKLVRVVAQAVGGIRREMTAPLAFPPTIRRTAIDSTLKVHCDTVTLTEDGALAGIGWAVCASGIAAISIELDQSFAGLAEIGIDRPDVGNNFPEIPSARKAGFKFNLKLPNRVAGECVLRITARGTQGEERVVLQPVLATAANTAEGAIDVIAGETEHIKFYLDLPAVRGGEAVEIVRGFMTLTGWAFARTGISAVEVHVDGALYGTAFAGIRREDIQAAFPDWDALLSGFAMLVPPQIMRPGRHQVRVRVCDNDGHAEEVSFSVMAEEAPEGPGPWQLRRKIKQAETDLNLAILQAANHRPHWALLMPLQATSTTEMQALASTLASLRYQAYPDWSLILAVPAATDTHACLATALQNNAQFQPHLHAITLDPATCLADITPPSGRLTLIMPGDLLGEDALMELALEAAIHKDADFIYSDERRIDPANGVMKAFFKPDWSPDLLLSTNYIGRLWAATHKLLRRTGLTFGQLMQEGDYSAILRLSEQAHAIRHVAKVLCERGPIPAEPAGAGRAALRAAMARRAINAEILPGCAKDIWRCKYALADTPKISIIMPSIATRGLIKITIDSIRSQTAWPDYEIIVLDNIPPSDDAEKNNWKGWMQANADLVIDIQEPFNWSRFNNIGAAHASGEYLLFLNDDMEVHDPFWLHGLMEHAQRPEVGATGPQLLYPDGRVQHAGIFLSKAVGRHAFRFYPHDEPGPFGLALTQRNVISVTGACYMVRRSLFDELQGFDEAHPVINNDLDFSLRCHRAGKRVIYTPHVTLTHHEMVSRSKLADVYDSEIFDNAWKDLFLQGDPYFNPYLTTETDDYLPEPEPLRQFQVGHPLIAAANIRKILAVKVDHIGDFIAAFPAFRKLKQHFPNAELTVLCARASLSLAAMEPAIDRVIEFNFFHARSEKGSLSVGEAELEQLQTTLEPLQFDLALDLRRQSDTRDILKYSGARWLAGFDMGYAMPWLDIAMEFEGDVARNFKRSHVTGSLLQFIDVVASACATDRRVVHATLDQTSARQILAALPNLQTSLEGLFNRPIICVHTGAGAVNKQWPAKHFSGLIDLLAGELRTNILLIGGPDEAEFATSVMQHVRRPAHVYSVVGQTSLRDLPSVLQACHLYVGNDSGPKHMAAALGVPTIGIHSGSVDAGEWGPMGTHTLTLRRDMTCGPCYIAMASDCPRSMACLHGISVGDVFRACQRMLTLRLEDDKPAQQVLETEQFA